MVVSAILAWLLAIPIILLSIMSASVILDILVFVFPEPAISTSVMELPLEEEEGEEEEEGRRRLHPALPSTLESSELMEMARPTILRLFRTPLLQPVTRGQ
jgi:hypothetical protein